MLAEEDVAHVKATWATVSTISGEAAELFDGKLFELDPSLRPSFKGDLQEQGRRLMQILGVAVASLVRLGSERSSRLRSERRGPRPTRPSRAS